MKKHLVLAIALATSGLAVADEKADISYMLGTDLGNNLKRSGIDLSVDDFVEGMRDILEGNETRLSGEQLEAVRTTWMTQQREVQERARAEAEAQRGEQAQANLEEGKLFLENNAQVAGVQTTPSGLQYRVIQEGDGARPGPDARVRVHYRGTLIDGTEFDSSYSRNEPTEFPLQGVIPGWTEGLQLMREGSKYEFFIPPELAYGERGTPGPIGPNATLKFEVELLNIL